MELRVRTGIALILNRRFIEKMGDDLNWHMASGKVGKILKGSLDSIPSHTSLVKIQIVGGKVC